MKRGRMIMKKRKKKMKMINKIMRIVKRKMMKNC
jgi:hypothetical protein